MYIGLQHPEIDCIERTGYPSWMQKYIDSEDEEFDEYAEYEEELYDEDAAYEEARDRRCFGIE